MAAIYIVRLTATAGNHLEEIYDYIEQHSPQNAPQMVRRLLDSIDSLELLPHRYPVVEDSKGFGVEVRSMPVRPFGAISRGRAQFVRDDSVGPAWCA